MSIRVDKIGRVDYVGALDLYKVHKVMASDKLTAAQKIEFMNKNGPEISSLVHKKISSAEFESIMKNRPLKIFRPLKNSYTKAGDKKLLAAALEIPPQDVNAYIDNVTSMITTMQNLESLGLSADDYDEVKTYIFRHGTKEEVLCYLDYELAWADNILTTLYSTLRYNSGGIADYFLRPVHRLDNLTMLNLYGVIDKNLQACQKTGKISDVEARETAENALAQIYQIQNNQKIKNAIRLKNELE